MRKTRALAIPGLLLVSLLAVGCGGGKPFSETGKSPSAKQSATPSTPQARLLASVQRATDAKTARVALDMTMSGFGMGGELRLAGAGFIDLTSRRLLMTLRNAGAGPSISIETRVVGGTAYVKTGDGWTSQPLGSTAADTPMPGNYLDYLQGVSGDVRVVGHETLRGDDTTRYAATLDLDRALTRIHDAARRTVVKRALSALGVPKFPVRVWIDGEGRLRKMELSIDLAPVAARLGAPPGAKPKIVETFELYDFGVPVNVVAPANAEPLVSPAVHDAETDLRNALTAAKTVYTDREMYSADVSLLQQVEPSLDWGRKLTVVVGGSSGEPNTVVCLSETADGVSYSLGDVASGPRAGTYYGHKACPRVVDAVTVSALGSRW